MNSELVEAFNALSREKNIDRDVLVTILEEIFRMMMRKEFSEDARFDVVVNVERGEIQIVHEKAIVETVTNPMTEISLSAVQKVTDEQLGVGEDYVEILDLEKTFGRRLIRTAFQELVRRIKDLEKDVIFNEYAGTVGEIIVGEVYHQRRGDVYILHNKNELLLPHAEQIARERYRKGATIRALVKEVVRENGVPRVIVSRSAPGFLVKLFSMEVPEIFDGIIEIKAVAREAGDRAKIAVISYDDRIDPVGACVGMKGVRIHAIVRELNSENIDIIQYSSDDEVFIARALAPAKLNSISLNRQAHTASVVIEEDQASAAIGKGGQNIRLASKLTGYEINLVRESMLEEYDMDLSELQEELGEQVYSILTEAEMLTAREVLDAKRNTLLTLLEDAGMDDKAIDEMLEMIKQELEEAVVEGEEEIEEEEEETEEEVSDTVVQPEPQHEKKEVQEQE